ncbi:CPBP family intramembrane glutamic endopeptidase [Wenxinia marina]|uniref:CAAX protease self-immunity n=1 Tax=Wenxinia marina DSM 24838 TaxID=1123501 RepID=A0A0D0PG39_9RHOB|nr:CPBP family intramembrane glutamic endopeptidase [Wenxinia marina]KIQ70301.1 CAAX protease self-immunity [Wenxinia marina DSM 24838]GGL54182.1 hypothetical protein GCM10011392_05750 [Wenxinia marina]
MTSPDPYAPAGAFSEPAHPRTDPWRVAVTVIAVWGTYIAGGVLLGASGWATGGAGGTLGLLALFLIPLGVLAVALRRLHARGLGSLCGPAPLALAQGRAALAVGLPAMALALVLPTTAAMGEAVMLRAPLPWLGAVGLALPLLVLQTGVEELFYRGYLLQQMRALSDRPLVWMVAPSALFAASHLFNAEPGLPAVFYVGWTFVFGLAAADLTARAGTIGPAWALHFLNNALMASLVAETGGPLSGLALVVVPARPPDLLYGLPPLALLIAFAITLWPVLILWLSGRIALRR